MKQLFIHSRAIASRPLAEGLAMAKAAGFTDVELDLDAVYQALASKGPRGLREIVQGSGAGVIAMGRIGPVTFVDKPGYEQALDRCMMAAELAEALRCPYLVVTPGDLPDEAITDKEITNETKHSLRELARIALKHDVGIAFEFLGAETSSVRNLRDALSIVYQADRVNVGLALDTFEFTVGGSRLDSLEKLDPRSLYLLRVNDAGLPEELAALDTEGSVKLLPGDGHAHPGPIAAMLRSGGFERNMGLEPAVEAYLGASSEELLGKCMDSLKPLAAPGTARSA